MLKFRIHPYALQPEEDKKYIKEGQARKKMLQKNIKTKIQKNIKTKIQKIQENINIKKNYILYINGFCRNVNSWKIFI
jgi:hypothetical protein